MSEWKTVIGPDRSDSQPLTERATSYRSAEAQYEELDSLHMESDPTTIEMITFLSVYAVSEVVSSISPTAKKADRLMFKIAGNAKRTMYSAKNRLLETLINNDPYFR